MNRIHTPTVVFILLGVSFGSIVEAAHTAGKVCWSDSDGIFRANANGANVEAVVVAPIDFPVDVAIDISGGKMYWDELGSVRLAKLDGSGAGTLVPGQFFVNGIALETGPASSNLDLALSYHGLNPGRIRARNLGTFVLRAGTAAVPLLRVPLPVIDPSVTPSIDFNLPPSGTLVYLTTLRSIASGQHLCAGVAAVELVMIAP